MSPSAVRGGVGVGDRDAGGDPGAGGDAAGEDLGAVGDVVGQVRRQHRRQLLGADPAQRLGAVDRALLREVDGGAHGGQRRALGRARLQQPELAALDRELDVLDVAVLALEQLGGVEQAPVGGRQRGRQLGQRQRVVGAGDDVLALAPGQPLAVGLGVAAERVAGEEHAGAGSVAEVAEDHRLDDHRGAAVLGDAPVLAVGLGAARGPGAEDGLDHRFQRLVGVGRHLFVGVAEDRLADLGGGRVLARLVEVGAEHGLAELVDEAAVGGAGEVAVAGERRQRFLDLVGDAEVEDRVHHPRHADRGARADRDQQRALAAAEGAAELFGQAADAGEDRAPGLVVELAAGGVEAAALLDRQAERRRHRQAEAAHPGDAVALAADHLAVGHGRAVEDDGAVGHGGHAVLPGRQPGRRTVKAPPRVRGRACGGGPRAARTRPCGSCRCGRR